MNSVDFDPLLTDTSHEKEPDLTVLQQPPTSGPVILEATKRPMGEDIDHTVLQNLPNLEVDFKLVEEKATTILSLKEVDQDLAKDGTIDEGRAVLASESFPELFTPRMPRQSFTKIPTKVNFAETRYHIGAVIAKEEAELLDLYQTYLLGPFEAAVKVMDSIREHTLPGLIRITESTKSEVEVNHAKIFDNKNSVVPLNEGIFEDLAKVNLLQLNVDDVRTQLKTIAEFKQAVATVQQAFQCPVVRGIFCKVLGHPQHESCGVSMVELGQFLMNGGLIDELNAQFKNLEREAKIVQQVVEEGRAISTKPELIAEHVVKNSKDLLCFDDCLRKHASLTHYLTLLFMATKQLILTYLEL